MTLCLCALIAVFSSAIPPIDAQVIPIEDEPLFTLIAEDKSNGGGGEIILTVTIPMSKEIPSKIRIERTASLEGEFREVGTIMPGEIRLADRVGIEDGCFYYYRGQAITSEGRQVFSPIVGPIESRGLWYKSGAIFTGIMSCLVVAVLLAFLLRAKSGHTMYIRPIPGLRAVEDAIGRATEMGKPVLYCSGVADVRCPGVLASLTVLSWVAEKIANYGAALTYPVNNPLTLTAGQEIVKESYLRAGRPELYNDDIVYFISGEQFAYAAAVCGVMERERPAVNFFFGSFWSETLILTESGVATEAMQIAATDMEHQIPFLVATCNYVIIGEEFYAASAYLSQDMNVKGSLKAQDLIKLIIVLLILTGVIFSTLEGTSNMNFDGFFEFFRR